jgi:RimJ/RimL family protein N-acetyltransferase
MITSTERLYLRELTINDAIHFCNMNNDPMCVKYTGYNPFGSIIASNLFLESYKKQYLDYEMVRWAVCLEETHESLGWCGH